MKLKQLFEATFNTDEVVDFIYDDVYKEFFNTIKKYKNGKQPTYDEIIISKKSYTATQLLQQIEDTKFQEAMTLKPVTVEAGTIFGGSSYSPIKRKITITFNMQLYGMLQDAINKKATFDEMMSQVQTTQQTNALTEFDGVKIKGSISHEISHWMSDVYYGNNLSKMIDKAHGASIGSAPDSTGKMNKILNRGHVDTYMADYEIDAQIHDIKELKRSLGQKIWDSISFNDLFDYSVGLQTTKNRIMKKSRKAASEFVRLIISRMHRETLLGKNMTGKIAL